ncbi:HAMP domain-containing histidine kinase [Halobacteria archaeon AArc-dxtr1]|nr:HAMP domain-containing histidine kinase [Halobacteria archaeon AArc-dxtr1]
MNARQSPAATVQLLVEDEANREALASIIEQQYAVRTGREQLDSDLYLVDDRSFSTYKADLEALNTATTPSFTPVVLVRRNGTHLEQSVLEAGCDVEQPLIDEVVDAPVRGPILHRRIENLLSRRELFRELEAQNERLAEFASVLSHDLRNPLQVASGRLELLEPAVPDAEAEHVEAIADSLERMESLIENVLSVAKEGAAVDAVAETALAPVVEEAWSVVESPSASVAIRDEGAVIRANREQLLTVFENLFRNAVEHGCQSDGPGNEEGPRANAVLIEVSVTERGVAVTDDGPGVPPAEREAIFERGYSASPDGTGLGLDIVANIVEAHGWEISVGESATGGARFEITGVTRVDQKA